MSLKGIVLNVVICVSKDVLEYARIFSVTVGLEKERVAGALGQPTTHKITVKKSKFKLKSAFMHACLLGVLEMRFYE